MKKQFKKGDLLWKKSCENGANIQPAIFVRNVRGDNAMVDIVNSSGDLSRESVALKNLAICTSAMSDIDFKSKDLQKAAKEAYDIMKKNDNTRCFSVSLDKDDVTKFKEFHAAMVKLEKISVPNEYVFFYEFYHFLKCSF